ncbi:MAG: DUF2130 domain-containing protein, partial [Clostridia bacterium]|nr:DUF2130 domain-containing protein [Clostridia bacterium]
MYEIRCPKCDEVFQVDGSGYAAIVKQVRDKEFERELESQKKSFENEKALAIREVGDQSAEEIRKLKEELYLLREKQESEGKLAVQNATHEKDIQLERASAEIERLKRELDAARDDKGRELTALKIAHSGELARKQAEAELAHARELQKKETQIIELTGKLDSAENSFRLKEESLKNQHRDELKRKDEEIEYYRDFKAHQSTKMVGESLEQHCEIQFNQLRATAFRNSYFEKDNDARTGSKGDFIYREFTEDKTEIVSIMFE